MTTGSGRRSHDTGSLAHRAWREAWLTVVSPSLPWGYVRLLGLAGIVEGVFLLAIWTTVPIGAVALPCLAAGVVVFGVSFVGQHRSRRP